LYEKVILGFPLSMGERPALSQAGGDRVRGKGLGRSLFIQTKNAIEKLRVE
jgi:hypothetical protein